MSVDALKSLCVLHPVQVAKQVMQSGVYVLGIVCLSLETFRCLMGISNSSVHNQHRVVGVVGGSAAAWLLDNVDFEHAIGVHCAVYSLSFRFACCQ